MRTIGFCVYIFLFSAWLLANAQTLWQKSVFGMNPAQVQKLFPEALPPSAPDSLYGGAMELLRISEISMVERKFSSSFFFKNSKLTNVMLTLTENETADGAKLIYKSLLDTLRNQYGPEAKMDSSDGILFSTMSSTWVSGKTSIMIYYNDFKGSDPLLNLSYGAGLPSKNR